MTTLYLVRHGETFDNVSQIMQGQTQGALNSNGVRQAEELRQRLVLTPIDAFVSSDLNRAVETCRIIAEGRTDKIVTTPLLRERDWGGFTGRFIPDLKDEAWPDDIESVDALKARAREFLQWIRKEFPEKSVLAVGHGIINKAIQSVFYDKPMPEVMRMQNAEVRTLLLE